MLSRSQIFANDVGLLPGGFATGIAIAEIYIVNLTSVFLRDQPETVKAVTGTCGHLQSVLDFYRSNGNRFPQVTVDQALELPATDASTWVHIVPDYPPNGRSITRAEELELIQHFGGAVWLTEMDHLSVPFYQAYTDTTRTKRCCGDFLLGNGEVLGLGERHVSAADVKSALDFHQTATKQYQWYMDIRSAKPLLETGWGVDIERFLAWVLKHDGIRDMVVMPRMKGLLALVVYGDNAVGSEIHAI